MKNTSNPIGLIVVLLIIQLPLMYVLLMGHRIVQNEVFANSNFHYGTLFGWLFLFLFPLTTYLFLNLTAALVNPIITRMLKRLAMVAVVAGLLWGVAGYALSGQMNFVFNQNMPDYNLRFKAFLALSSLPLVIPLVVGAVLFIASIVRVVKPKNDV